MSKEPEQPSGKSAPQSASPGNAAQQAVQAPATQAAAAPPTSLSEIPDQVTLALSQFNLIAATIGLGVTQYAQFQQRAKCEDPLHWCLPDLACSAKLGLGAADRARLDENIKRCRRGTITVG